MKKKEDVLDSLQVNLITNDKEMYKKFKILATVLNKTVRQCIREAVIDYMKKHQIEKL